MVSDASSPTFPRLVRQLAALSSTRWPAPIVLGVLVVLLVRVLYVVHARHCFEDAYINFRCADNWLHSGQPNYNIGSRIMAATSALWLAVTTAIVAIVRPGRDPSVLLFVVAILLDLATYLFALRLMRSTAEVLVWTLAYAFMPVFILATGHGLETNLLVMCGVAAAATTGVPRFVFLGLLASIRPEGRIYATAIALASDGRAGVGGRSGHCSLFRGCGFRVSMVRRSASRISCCGRGPFGCGHVWISSLVEGLRLHPRRCGDRCLLAARLERRRTETRNGADVFRAGCEGPGSCGSRRHGGVGASGHRGVESGESGH